jgi:hypothetical protein
MQKITKKWTPLKSAIDRGVLTMNQVYWHIKRGTWRDGYVVKKNGAGTRWKYFCEEDWLKWEKLDNYHAA